MALAPLLGVSRGGDLVSLVKRGVLDSNAPTTGAEHGADAPMEARSVLPEPLGEQGSELLGRAHVGAQVRAESPFVGRVRIVETVGHWLVSFCPLWARLWRFWGPFGPLGPPSPTTLLLRLP